MITVRDIIRGALGRFYPGAVVGALATSLAIGPPSYLASIWPRLIGGTLIAAGLGAVGFALALAAIRRRLRVDADVAGRKSAVAGFVAAGAAFSLLAFNSSFLVMTVSLFGFSSAYVVRTIAIPIIAGFAATLAVYFPWLSGSPERISDAEVERQELGSGPAHYTVKRPQNANTDSR